MALRKEKTAATQQKKGVKGKAKKAVAALVTQKKGTQQADENPITSAQWGKGMLKLGPGKTWLKGKQEASYIPKVRDMALTPSRPRKQAEDRPVTRSSKRKLLDPVTSEHDIRAKKHASSKLSSSSFSDDKEERDDKVDSPASQQSDCQISQPASTPEHLAEQVANRTGTILKNLLSPVYSLFRVDRPNDSSTSSQETSPLPSTKTRTPPRSLRSESPENLPDCEVNTLPVSKDEKRASIENSSVKQVEEAELDSNDDEETSIRFHSDQRDKLAGEEVNEDGEEPDEEDDLEFYDPYVFIKSLPPLETQGGTWRRCLLPKQKIQRKTLVLDLDETLVHSELQDQCLPNSWFKMMIQNELKYVCVGKRPHLQTFLEKCSALFEVVIFTASMKHYADAVINRLDPTGKLIQHRLFRDSCLPVYGNYMKDLSILGRDLTQTVIIDNSPQAYGYQLSNGIPIESWYDDPEDEELMKLIPFLEVLAGAENVQPHVRDTFQTHKLVEAAQSVSPEPEFLEQPV